MTMSNSDARKRQMETIRTIDGEEVETWPKPVTPKPPPSIAELLAVAWDQGYKAHVHDRNPYREEK